MRLCIYICIYYFADAWDETSTRKAVYFKTDTTSWKVSTIPQSSVDDTNPSHLSITLKPDEYCFLLIL